MIPCQTVKLNNGVNIPILGLGVYQSKNGDETAGAVRCAIECGYRHIDTAKAYGNEASVGQGLRESGVRREELFITTKLWNEDVRSGNVSGALHESLANLRLDYVDLYLIHWPAEGFVAAWGKLEKLYHQGLIRAIGVSNFQIHHLEALARGHAMVPAINQIERHPLLTQEPLKAYCAEKGIACEAWSPLGGTGGSLLSSPVIRGIAEQYGKSPAQIILRWDIQSGVIVIPKSVHRDRIQSNSEVFDFALSEEDMALIDRMNRDQRVGPDPDNFNF